MNDQLSADFLGIEHLDALMHLSPSGILIVDSMGYICKINSSALSLLKLEAEDCIGDHFFNVLNFYDLDNDDTDLFRDTFHKTALMKTKKNYKLRLSISFKVVYSVCDGEPSSIISFNQIAEAPKSEKKTRGSFAAEHDFGSIVSCSDTMNEVIKISKIAAKSSSNVLLYGESGTGKELIAQAIHNYSERTSQPFVALNCGCLPHNLIESELFGYESGAFTGARLGGQAGKFELADGGTIFLDEIGDMPLALQVSLLRVLQTKEVVRLGGKAPKQLDVRIIAATNQKLRQAILNKTFRSDLYYRLNVFGINIPTLKERRDDIKPLVNHFILQSNLRANKTIKGVEPPVLQLFLSYDWPGNIRELENIIEWAVNMAHDSIIKICDIPSTLIQNTLLHTAMSGQGNCEDALSLERETLTAALESAKGNIKKVSDMLGISRRSLYRRLEKLEIDYPSFRRK